MDLELARRTLLHHARSKQNGKFPDPAASSATRTNPICGDLVEVRLDVRGPRIEAAGFRAEACAICQAAASLLCEVVRGQTVAAARTLANAFEAEITAPADAPWPSELAAVECFEHLRVNPVRRACAMLPWVALRAALPMDLV